MKFDESKERIPIWGKMIPGNTGESKHDRMNWDDTLTPQDLFTKYPGIWDKTTDLIGDMRGNDTLVYREEIKDGYAGENYDDVPFLVPYLVPGSKKCVISCPGGAYLSKSIGNEGEDIAEFLNAAGISCFVLWYRSYPYKAPYMFLDLQRAIRYLRFHAGEYGFDPDKIATVGFSAGGNLAGVQAVCFRNESIAIDGYKPDEIDQTDGSPNAVGLIYPAVTVANDKIQVVMADVETYNDPVKRKQFSEQYEMKDHVKAGDAPMFLCNTVDDDVIDPFHMVEFARACRENKVPFELHVFPYGGHGFGGCKPQPAPPIPGMAMPDYSAAEQWKELFVNWLNRTLK